MPSALDLVFKKNIELPKQCSSKCTQCVHFSQYLHKTCGADGDDGHMDIVTMSLQSGKSVFTIVQDLHKIQISRAGLCGDQHKRGQCGKVGTHWLRQLFFLNQKRRRGKVLQNLIRFLDTQVSLAPTHVSPLVGRLVGWSYI